MPELNAALKVSSDWKSTISSVYPYAEGEILPLPSSHIKWLIREDTRAPMSESDNDSLELGFIVQSVTSNIPSYMSLYKQLLSNNVDYDKINKEFFNSELTIDEIKNLNMKLNDNESSFIFRFNNRYLEISFRESNTLSL